LFSSSTLLLFVGAALGLLVVPGPAVTYIVTRSVSQGRNAGMASVLGIELASLVHSIAAALGLSAILYASAFAFHMVKYAGAAYLVYMGIRVLFSTATPGTREQGNALTFRQLFRTGFLVNLLNPKTALFFYAFLPQFVDPAHGSSAIQILLLGILFVLLATCTDSTYALMSSSIGTLLTRRAGFQKIQRYVTGGIYITLGLAAATVGHGKNE
jgi:threonine/homoserine/homoserine lactone efflux protein